MYGTCTVMNSVGGVDVSLYCTVGYRTVMDRVGGVDVSLYCTVRN